MAVGIQKEFHPLSSGEFDLTDPERFEDIDRKHQRVSEYLIAHDFDGIFLQRTHNLAWFTSGATCPERSPGLAAATLFITPEARLCVTNNAESSYLFEKQFGGLGFQLKERPWHEGRNGLLDDLCRGRSVASDTGYGETIRADADVDKLRLPLEPIECGRMRQLGKFVAHAVEATARNVEPGHSESEIAGHLSHRLLKHEVVPLRLHVAADGRAARFPSWTYSNLPLNRWCLISAIGMRWGLCCAATRIMSFDKPEAPVMAAFQAASLVEASAVFFSRTGVPFSEIWPKVKRIYEKVEHPDEWRSREQADLIGYLPSETALVPQSDRLLEPNLAVHWHPGIGPIQLGDTLLITPESPEIVTVPDQWPLLGITVKGEPVNLPDMLIR